MLKAYSHTMLYVVDLARAVAWYQDILGFRSRFHIPDTYASLQHPQLNCRLDLHPTEAQAADVGFGPLPYFSVENIEHALAELDRLGVKHSAILQEGPSPRFATLWDSEGNALGLEEAVSRE